MNQIAAIKQAAGVDDIITIIADCITGIWKDDELFDVRDYSLQQLVEFVENLSPRHLDKINKFFTTLPSLTHTLDYTCTKCEASNTAVLEGLQSFFV
jgi:hypothetical protein